MVFSMVRKEPDFLQELYLGQYFEKLVKRFLETLPQLRKAKPKPKGKIQRKDAKKESSDADQGEN